jgi:hypothetical protein
MQTKMPSQFQAIRASLGSLDPYYSPGKGPHQTQLKINSFIFTCAHKTTKRSVLSRKKTLEINECFNYSKRLSIFDKIRTNQDNGMKFGQKKRGD